MEKLKALLAVDELLFKDYAMTFSRKAKGQVIILFLTKVDRHTNGKRYHAIEIVLQATPDN